MSLIRSRVRESRAGEFLLGLRDGMTARSDDLSVPFNGQTVRAQAVAQLLDTFRPTAVVETGTFRGSTTQFLAESGPFTVHTVEVQRRHYWAAWRRLKVYDNIVRYLGDSREFLRDARENGIVAGRTFLYLDAHWDPNDVPLVDEIGEVQASTAEVLIVIDDFRVPGDPGFGFDEYGESRLELEQLPPGVRENFSLYFPAYRSEEETGARRGMLILARGPSAVASADSCALLRPA